MDTGSLSAPRSPLAHAHWPRGANALPGRVGIFSRLASLSRVHMCLRGEIHVRGAEGPAPFSTRDWVTTPIRVDKLSPVSARRLGGTIKDGDLSPSGEVIIHIGATVRRQRGELIINLKEEEEDRDISFIS